MAAAPVAGADRGMSAPRLTTHRPPWIERAKLKAMVSPRQSLQRRLTRSRCSARPVQGRGSPLEPEFDTT